MSDELGADEACTKAPHPHPHGAAAEAAHRAGADAFFEVRQLLTRQRRVTTVVAAWCAQVAATRRPHPLLLVICFLLWYCIDMSIMTLYAIL